jgi:hypothetical protein
MDSSESLAVGEQDVAITTSKSAAAKTAAVSDLPDELLALIIEYLHTRIDKSQEDESVFRALLR